MSNPGLTDEFLWEMCRKYHFDHDGNLADLARAEGKPHSTVTNWKRNWEARGIDPHVLGNDDENAVEIIGLKDQIRALESELKSIQRDNVTAEVIRQHILGMAAQTPPLPDWLTKIPKGGKTPHVPSTLWSDWHWGEVVDPAEVNGINEYNMGIAHKRALALQDHLLDVCFNHGPGNYPGIVVNLGGDLVSGDIHEEITSTNELPIMPVVIDVLGVLIKMLKTMAEHFGRVLVTGVAGNHGRTTTKPRKKQMSYSNFDWLICSLLEKHFEDDDRLRFHVPAGADAYYRIYNHRYLLTHGDNLGVRGGDGIIGALGPILRGDFKTRHQSAALFQPFDTLLMGHWHQWLPLAPRLIVNGSLKGFDEYAKLQLRAIPERPVQGLWFTHPTNGIVSALPLFVTDSERTEQAPWASI